LCYCGGEEMIDLETAVSEAIKLREIYDSLAGEYRVLYFSAPVSGHGDTRRRFDSKRDSAYIVAGTHFFCHGHLTAVAIEERSRNPNYCKTCYENIRV